MVCVHEIILIYSPLAKATFCKVSRFISLFEKIVTIDYRLADNLFTFLTALIMKLATTFNVAPEIFYHL